MTVASDTERYFIASVPPSPILERVTELKEYFKSQYQSKAALNSPPHITLHMPFEWKRKAENRLITMLEKFFTNEVSFNIKLKNFGTFPPRVIFLNVEDSTNLAAMQKRLTLYCRRELNLFNADYQDRPFHAHMTLAFRDLKKSAFESAWNEFRLKTFEENYLALEISLLKHVDGKWEVLQNFKLGS